MDPENALEILNSINGSHCWIGESYGYGSGGSLLKLTADGLYEYGSFGGTDLTKPLSSPFSKSEYNQAKKHIENGTENNFDDEIIKMVKQGCKPGVEYYCLDLYSEEEYGTIEELLERMIEIAADGDSPEFTAWKDMDSVDHVKWVRVLGYIQRGYRSVFDIPENQ